MGNNRNRTTAQQFQWGLLLLLFFALRLYHLQALPLHNDEGLHLTRAVAVWNLHPFWDITDGKIINHWAIALFYPQNAPDFVARIATLFVVLPGVAAGYALVRHIAGHRAALISIGLWGLSPYLFFYERLAQSDAEAAAWVVVAVWAALLLTERGSWWAAVRVGVALSVATLMKFTAAPYAIVITLLILSLGDLPWCVRAYPADPQFRRSAVVRACPSPDCDCRCGGARLCLALTLSLLAQRNVLRCCAWLDFRYSRYREFRPRL